MSLLLGLALAFGAPARQSENAPAASVQVHQIDKAKWNADAAVKSAPRDKNGRVTITVPVDYTGVDNSVNSDHKGMLVLKDPAPKIFQLPLAKFPDQRNRVEIVVKPEAAEALKKRFKADPAVYLKGRTVRVSGAISVVFYDCFPSISIYTVTVANVDDLAVVDGK